MVMEFPECSQPLIRCAFPGPGLEASIERWHRSAVGSSASAAMEWLNGTRTTLVVQECRDLRNHYTIKKENYCLCTLVVCWKIWIDHLALKYGVATVVDTQHFYQRRPRCGGRLLKQSQACSFRQKSCSVVVLEQNKHKHMCTQEYPMGYARQVMKLHTKHMARNPFF